MPKFKNLEENTEMAVDPNRVQGQGANANQGRQATPLEPYDGDEDYGRGRYSRRGGGGSNPFDMKVILVGAIVALIIVFVMNQVIMPVPSRSAYQADITRLENDLVTGRKSVDTLTGRVANLEQVITKNNDDLTKKITGFATSAQVDALSKRMDQTDNKIAGIPNSKSDIDKLGVTITDLNNRLSGLSSTVANQAQSIQKLQTAPTPTPVPTTVPSGSSSPYGITGSTSTYNGVTASITSLYSFGGGPSLLTLQASGATGGAVTNVTLGNGGSGYPAVTAVTFYPVDGKGSGAAATATVTLNAGPISVVTLTNNGGTGYTSVPTVTVSGGNGTGAVVTAIINNGAVSGFIVSSPGSNYTSPQVIISGGGATVPATAVAQITPTTGYVSGVSLYQGGAGYTSPPRVVFSGGTGATATSEVNLTISPIVPGTVSQSFSMTVVNNSAVVAHNIQLGIGITITDSNGMPLSTLPTWLTGNTNLTMSSTGIGMIWTLATTYAPSTWVFSNTGSGNPFGFGSLDLNPGQSVQTNQYVNWSNNDSQQHTIYVYPVVKVIYWQ